MSTSSQNQMLALNSQGIDLSQVVQAQMMLMVTPDSMLVRTMFPHRFLLASQQQGMSNKG